ncbi:hypothetical protein ACOME3_008240 [Neoechinorhynchus agilis]
MSVVLETTIGCVTIDLYYRERPICTFNFLKLCERSRFHSQQPNFIIQIFRLFNPKNAGEDETGNPCSECLIRSTVASFQLNAPPS